MSTLSSASPRAVEPCSRHHLISTLLITMLVLSVGFSLVLGPMNLPSVDGMLAVVDKLLDTQFSELKDYEKAIVLELRLPRLLLALMVGAILAQCGAVMQGLFRNPLADPGIVGVSSGAAVGAVIAIGLLPAALSGLVGSYIRLCRRVADDPARLWSRPLATRDLSTDATSRWRCDFGFCRCTHRFYFLLR